MLTHPLIQKNNDLPKSLNTTIKKRKQNIDYQFLSLEKCLAIKENQYRSKHNTKDYYPELIDNRINYLLNKQSELALSQLDKLIHEAEVFSPSENQFKRILNDPDEYLLPELPKEGINHVFEGFLLEDGTLLEVPPRINDETIPF